jgi:hypothetical protein
MFRITMNNQIKPGMVEIRIQSTLPSRPAAPLASDVDELR